MRFIFQLIHREVGKDAMLKLHVVGHKSLKIVQKVQKPRSRMNFRLGARMSQEGEEALPERQEKQFNKRLETRQTCDQWETKPVSPPLRYWLTQELEGNQPSSQSRDQEGRDFLLLIRQQNLRESTCLLRHSPTQTTQSEYFSATCCRGPKFSKSQCLSLFAPPLQVF
jgi:hypothetical protein